MVASRNTFNTVLHQQSNKQNSENAASTNNVMINKSHKLKGIKITSRPMLTPLVIEKKYKHKAVPVQPMNECIIENVKDEMVCSQSFFFVEDKIQTVTDSPHDDFVIIM